mgnify:CR=1 FL=1
MRAITGIIIFSLGLMSFESHAAINKCAAFFDVTASVKVKALPAKDRLQAAAKELGQSWTDANISTGTTRLYAAQVDVNANMKDLAETILRTNFSSHTNESLPSTARIAVDSRKLTSKISGRTIEKKAALEEVMQSVSDSNAFSQYNKEMEDQLLEVIRILESERYNPNRGGIRRGTPPIVPVPAVIDFSSAKTSVKSSTTNEKTKVEAYVFRNTETGKVIIVFTIEGTM